MAVLFAGVGLALLVTALLGKAMKVGGVEPPVPTTPIGRGVAGGLGAALLGVALVLGGVVPLPPGPSGSPSPSAGSLADATATASAEIPVTSAPVPTDPPSFTEPPTPVPPTPVPPTLPPLGDGPWRGMPPDFNDGIDAAVTRDIGFMYLFEADVYIRFDDLVSGVGGGPTVTAGNWHGMPADFAAGIDAATERSDGRIYFFSGDRYIRFPADLTQDATAPVSIAGNWRGMPGSFNSKIDAALTDGAGLIYLFRGGQYVRFSDISQGVDAGYPKSIASRWTGMPETFDAGIDAAMMAPDGTIFFFKDQLYVRFSNGQTEMDSGYPRRIDS